MGLACDFSKKLELQPFTATVNTNGEIHGRKFNDAPDDRTDMHDR
jgi:hypothetical protein